MEISWLEDFVSLAKSCNFSRSAEQRHVTQPAFSRRIRALENWAGTPLVDRSQQPIKLTESGLSFLDKAIQVIKILHDEREKLSGRKDSEKNLVRILAEQSLGQTLLPSWIGQLQCCFPKIQFETQSNSIQHCTNALQKHDCDLILFYSSKHLRSSSNTLSQSKTGSLNIESVKLSEDSLIPVLSKKLLNDKLSGSLPYLAYSEHTFFGQLTQTLKREQFNQLDLEYRCEHDNPYILLNLVHKGFGVAWLPKSLVEIDLKLGSLVTLSSQQDALELSMDVMAYRFIPEKIENKSKAQHSLGADKLQNSEIIWNYLNNQDSLVNEQEDDQVVGFI